MLYLSSLGFDALKDELSFHWGDHNHSAGAPALALNGHVRARFFRLSLHIYVLNVKLLDFTIQISFATSFYITKFGNLMLKYFDFPDS